MLLNILTIIKLMLYQAWEMCIVSEWNGDLRYISHIIAVIWGVVFFCGCNNHCFGCWTIDWPIANTNGNSFGLRLRKCTPWYAERYSWLGFVEIWNYLSMLPLKPLCGKHCELCAIPEKQIHPKMGNLVGFEPTTP